MDWNPAQYLRYGAARLQPTLDLVARLVPRLPAAQLQRIVDLGCGPGNSTDVLAGQWPQAAVLGLDASPAMLVQARAEHPELNFAEDDITAWAAAGGADFDLVFANASLQWVPDPAGLLPHLLGRVVPGGALAFQVPANHHAAVCQIPRDLAASPAWRDAIRLEAVSEWSSAELSFYYDTLAPHAARIDLWETEYVQVMADAAEILEWYRGSGLRPFLAALPDEDARRRFCDEYFAGLRAAYPPQPNGRILFPFRRRFVIALAR